MKYIITFLATALKTIIWLSGPATLLGIWIAWYRGPAMFENWAWVEAKYVLGISLSANFFGLLWWTWEKTPKLAIVGMSKQTLQDGNLHRIKITVRNNSITTDRFSVHVRAQKDGKQVDFGLLERYSVKTENREQEFVQYGRDENHRFELSGGQIKSLYIFSIDSTLTLFHTPAYVMANLVPFDGWRIFVSVEASNCSREYEVVHNKTDEKIRFYLRSRWLDRFGFDIPAKAPPSVPEKKKLKSK